MGTLFIFIGILIFGAHLFSALFHRVPIPDMMLLVLVGIIVGPLLHWLTPDMFGQVGGAFSSLTLLFILFDSGVDMRLSDIRHSWRPMVTIMFSTFLMSMTVTAAVARILGMEWGSGLLLGSIVAGTAAAVVIPLTGHLNISPKTRTILSLESAISAVLSIVVAMAILDGYSVGEVNFLAVIAKVLLSLAFALLMGLLGGIFWSSLLTKVRKIKNSMFLTPAFMFVIYGIVEAIGLNGSIAAMAFGLVLGNPTYFDIGRIWFGIDHKPQPLLDQEKLFYKEIVFLLKTFFFVYIGICMPFSNSQAFLFGALICLAIYAGRFALVQLPRKSIDTRDRYSIGLCVPKGLAAAALASMPESVNQNLGYAAIPGASLIKETTYAIILCSIILTSILVIVRGKDIIISSKTTPSNK